MSSRQDLTPGPFLRGEGEPETRDFSPDPSVLWLFKAESGSPTPPLATYRMQLQPDFPLDAAAALADYLAALGVSHLYSSPVLQATAGSAHGYDVVDSHRVNQELGGADAFNRLTDALAAHELGLVLDIVPNHMAIGGRENAWWWDVLENGPSSRYARYFDVDWDPPEAKLRNRVLLPILGERYGQALEDGKIQAQRKGGDFTLHYFDHEFPIAPRSLDTLLVSAASRLNATDQANQIDHSAQADQLAFLADAFGALPPASATDGESALRRHRDKEVLRGLLADLCQSEVVAGAIDAALADLNADPVALDALLERQNYRLTFWRAAERELDYRRFFDINTLAGLRAEDARVFLDGHALVLRWLADGVVSGLRVDHVDGLRDPATYLQRLRSRAGDAWIVVEKILEPGEQLSTEWPIAGTTGYDFLNRVNALYVNPAAEDDFTEFYADFTDQPIDYDSLCREKKLLALRETLGSDVNRLTALWLDVCQRHWRRRDFTRHELQEALREAIADFPVYRTYVQADAANTTAGTSPVRPEDAAVIERALAVARERRPDLDGALFDFLCDLLLLRETGDLESELVMRFQQLTGPAMAKGVEDTVFYCYNRLVSLNEVGGDPSRFGGSVEAFHAACSETHAQWPLAMLATSTHDTKRSEDVRARINLLTEIPDRWRDTVRRWASHNDWLRRGDPGDPERRLPDRNTEYLFYQTLVGAWPLDAERAVAYMLKAAHEAKLYTSWTTPNEDYDAALEAFVRGALADEGFTADVARFVEPLLIPGWITSLSQTLLKLTAPGVPDIYQGCELWDFSLVDPDNRRPVDYDLRRRLLGELDDLPDETGPETIWEQRAEGLPKLWIIRQALAVRGKLPQCFGAQATYTPLIAQGEKAEHLVAFARGMAGGEAGPQVITLAPRLTLRLAGDWSDTTVALPAGRWCNALTGEQIIGGAAVALTDLLRRFPVALLERDE